MQGRNLIYCQIARKARGNEREREENLRKHEQYYLIVYKMMEAHDGREGNPQPITRLLW